MKFMIDSGKRGGRDQPAPLFEKARHCGGRLTQCFRTGQNKLSWSENKLITEFPLAMRCIVSAISGATESWRILVHPRALSLKGMVLVTTTSSRAVPWAMRSMAGPEKIGCVQ